MNLEDVFEEGNFIEYRNYRVSETDITFLINQLKGEKGIKRIKDLIRIVGYLPEELLHPILKAGLDFKDPSSPKKWIYHVVRLFGEENVQEELFNFIKKGTHKDVMNSLMTLYFISPRVRKIRRGQDEKIVEWKWKWNKTGYEEFINEDVDEEQIDQSENFKRRRRDFFIEEFKNSKNLVVKYYLGLYFRMYDNWPYTENQLALETISEIKKEGFPKNQEELKVAIKGNKELEDYYYYYKSEERK